MTAPTTAPVIVLAHGSRHPLADAAIHEVAESVGAQAAFLDFSPRTLQNQARLLAAHGHKSAQVVPLLFTDAFHARHDVPEAVEETSKATGLNITVTPTLGTGADIADLLVTQAKAEQARFDNLVIYAVGSSNKGANRAVQELARTVGQEMRMPCAALFATGTGADRGVAGLRAHCAQQGSTHVIPLFVAPGTLWDQAVESQIPQASFGAPLGTALAAVIEHRLLTTESFESS